MRKSLPLGLLVFLPHFAAAVATKPLPSLGEPALSPDRSEIAFVSGGDIWTVPAKGGEARLLVSDPATESRPLYSPDGSKLAFTSSRTGNGDVYVLTFATGELVRLTYSDAPELVDGWSRDGKWLYFTSNGNDIGRANDIFRVSLNGGTPLEVTHDRYYNEFRAAPSPDGTRLAFVAKGISFNQWWRHGHAHIDESEIWLKGISEEGAYQRIVQEDAKQGWPMWSEDGQSIFYTSDRSGAENIFRQTLDSKAVSKQLTQFKDGRLLWPSISYDGREIVFERGFSVWKADTKSGAAARIPITLRGAPSTPTVTHQQLNRFSDLSLSPDGKKIAVIAHGDIFAASATEGGDAIRVTSTPAPETWVRWSPDSKRLVYVSARNGHEQLFEYDLVKNNERQLTQSNEDDERPLFSPDGKLLAFLHGGNELHVLTMDSGKEDKLASGSLQTAALAWSPDSKFLAYTSVGAKSFRNVSVVAAAGGIAQPVSFLANGQTAGGGIAWSPDSKYLLFDTAQRSEPSQIARLDLIPHLPKFREDQFADLFRNSQPGRSPDRRPDAEEKEPVDVPAKKMAPTRIAFEGIRERLSFVPLGFDSGHPMISPDGKTLVFTATTGNQVNLYSYSLDELAAAPSARQLTSTRFPKSNYQFTPDSKSIYFLEAGRVVALPLESHMPKAIAVTAGLDVDFDTEKLAVFEQGWALLNKRFFDDKFNGRDWTQLREEFRPYVAGAHTPDEMRRVMALMIGELNSSHSGINPPPPTADTASAAFSPAPAPVGRLGLRFERESYEAGKGLIIREVVPVGPAALEGSIQVGDTLLAIDGAPVNASANLDHLLENKVNKRVVLQIASAQNSGAKRDAVVRPVALATEKGLLYRSWVEANRAYVERASGGKLGYVHIADMSAQALNQLYIDLDVQNQTKSGVVVDVRDNNGGFVNAYALDVFTRTNYLTMTPRGGKAAPARPTLGQRALGLPTILVTNQDSLSDAEDFTEGYRSLKLGKVVGEPTAGWIIYTSNTPLLDGSVIRVPGIRITGHDGGPMEMHPRAVDVEVERLAGDWLQGKDVQLDRAVKELLAQLKQ
jgi:Tol biopolymer transport system component